MLRGNEEGAAMETLSDILDDTTSFEKVATALCSPKARCGIPTVSSSSSMCAATVCSGSRLASRTKKSAKRKAATA